MSFGESLNPNLAAHYMMCDFDINPRDGYGPTFLGPARPVIFGKSPARPVKCICSGAPAGFRFGGEHFRGSASKGVRGAEPPGHGRSRDFFRGGGHFLKRISKNFQKNFQKIFKNI